MKVTKVWVNKYTSGKLVGFADVQLSLDGGNEGHMTWKGFKLFQGKDGINIALPSKKDEQGKKDENGKPIYHPVIVIPGTEEKPNPVGAEFKEHLRQEIENAFNALQSSDNQNQGQGFDNDDGVPF